jgi:single-stranded DNA-specific DHH superfamily exonuclease
MKQKNMQLMNRFESWMKGLQLGDKIAVLHHTDPDGISSAVVMNKAIEKIRGKKIDLRINQKSDELFISNESYKQLRAHHINKIIILDMCVDQFINHSKGSTLKKIQKFANILILDHHKLYNDVNSKKCILIKPQMLFTGIDPASYCCSKLTYDLCMNIIDISEADWIAALGIIGDCAYPSWNEFIHSTLKKYHIPLTKDILKTRLGKITELIFYAEAYDSKKIGQCFEILNTAHIYQDVLKSSLHRYRKTVEQEISYWKSNVVRLAYHYPQQELIFDFIKPKYPIKAAISTMISYKYPHTTVIIAQDMNNGIIQLSARRRDNKVAVNALLEKATKGLKDAQGGGHATAAGGVLRTKDIFAFKENVLRLLSKT